MRESFDADALIVGAGPAGTSTAILLRLAGWHVILVEKCVYPRQKVCGECLSAAALALLDELGVGAAVQARAGPELTRVGWMNGASTLVARLPPCTDGPYRYGRALGRDHLDTILIDRAIGLGVMLIQPGTLRSVRGAVGSFECDIQLSTRDETKNFRSPALVTKRVPIVIDAHGSWEQALTDRTGGSTRRRPRLGSDLFGFKASFDNATLPEGLLPVLSFRGGYGGLVVAEDRRLTFAGCIRRDTLSALRARLPGASAGGAFEHHVRASCDGVKAAILGAHRSTPWLSAGPLRPQINLKRTDRLFSVGNAAGETHPLIGEGMSMALQSAFLLASNLTRQPARVIDAARAGEIHQAYRCAWQKAFAQRRRLAALLAQIAVRPLLSRPVTMWIQSVPQVMTVAAHLAGKARTPAYQLRLFEGST